MLIPSLPKELRKGQNLRKIREHAGLWQKGYLIFLWKLHKVPSTKLIGSGFGDEKWVVEGL